MVAPSTTHDSDEDFDATVTRAVRVLSANPANVAFALTAARIIRDAVRQPAGVSDTSSVIATLSSLADGGAVAPEVVEAAKAVQDALTKPYIETADGFGTFCSNPGECHLEMQLPLVGDVFVHVLARFVCVCVRVLELSVRLSVPMETIEAVLGMWCQ